jgi:hypothetical protein
MSSYRPRGGHAVPASTRPVKQPVATAVGDVAALNDLHRTRSLTRSGIPYAADEVAFLQNSALNAREMLCSTKRTHHEAPEGVIMSSEWLEKNTQWTAVPPSRLTSTERDRRRLAQVTAEKASSATEGGARSRRRIAERRTSESSSEMGDASDTPSVRVRREPQLRLPHQKRLSE